MARVEVEKPASRETTAIIQEERDGTCHQGSKDGFRSKF